MSEQSVSEKRLQAAVPAQEALSAPGADRLGRLSHRAFYAIVIAMTLTGVTLAVQSGVIALVMGAHPGIPADLWIFPFRCAHYVISRLLMGLVLLHLAGVAYHTFHLRDHLLRRMSFGRRHHEPVNPATARPRP